MAVISVPRAFGSVLILTVTPPAPPVPGIKIVWVTRDMKTQWQTRDMKDIWKTRG